MKEVIGNVNLIRCSKKGQLTNLYPGLQNWVRKTKTNKQNTYISPWSQDNEKTWYWGVAAWLLHWVLPNRLLSSSLERMVTLPVDRKFRPSEKIVYIRGYHLPPAFLPSPQDGFPSLWRHQHILAKTSSALFSDPTHFFPWQNCESQKMNGMGSLPSSVSSFCPAPSSFIWWTIPEDLFP